MKNLFNTKSIGLLAFFAFFLVCSLSSASATVVNENTNATYGTIQAAVNGAGSNHVLSVNNDTYYNENVNVNKSVTIKSNGAATVQGSSSSPVFNVTANNVKIKNLTITGGTYGVYLYDRSNCEVSGNTVTNSSIAGIGVWNSAVGSWVDAYNRYNNITNNNVSYNQGNGINFIQTAYNYLSYNTVTHNEGDGIYFYTAFKTTILSNIVSNNDGNGILIDNCAGMAGDTGMLNCPCGCNWGNSIEQCTITNNGLNGINIYQSCGIFVRNHNNISYNGQNGIYIEGSYQGVDMEGIASGANLIQEANTIQGNTGYGVYLVDDESTIINNNNFIDNNNGGKQAFADEDCDTVSASGNYWDDWTGTPSYYAFDGSKGATDVSPSSTLNT